MLARSRGAYEVLLDQERLENISAVCTSGVFSFTPLSSISLHPSQADLNLIYFFLLSAHTQALKVRISSQAYGRRLGPQTCP